MLSFKQEKTSNDSQNTIPSDEVDAYMAQCNLFLGDMDETCTQETPSHQPAHFDAMKQKIVITPIDATKLVKAEVSQESDSDSSFTNPVREVKKIPIQKRKRLEEDNASSSSGEEESEEEIVVSNSSMTKPYKNDLKRIKHNSLATSIFRQTGGKSIKAESNDQLDNWWCPNKICLMEVRSRFFFANAKLAKSMIGDALSQRLELRVKQNSSLLSALPSFTSNPIVRQIASCHLEKWLQSPALSGLARILLSHIVNDMQNSDPPLEEDVKAIETIISMNLKSNQVSLFKKKWHGPN